MQLFFGVFRFHINTADGGAEHTNLGSVVACLDQNGFILDSDDFSDNAADCGDLVTDRQGIQHILFFLFLLFLRAVKEEVKDCQKDYNHNHG